MKTAKRALAVVLAVAVILSGWVWIAPEKNMVSAELTGDSSYLFAYFTGTSIEGQTIHLAISRDGLNYTKLRNNEPVIVPSKGTGCVRDPYLWYNERDEYYYILATDLDFTDTGSDYSDNSESFIVWRSKDLINWYDETMIDVKAILNRLGKNTNNMQAVWAPQVLWDGTEFVVYFSLQCDETSNGSWNPLTIVYLKTSDLLDESQYDEYGVIYNPGRHVIDADIIKNPNSTICSIRTNLLRTKFSQSIIWFLIMVLPVLTTHPITLMTAEVLSFSRKSVKISRAVTPSLMTTVIWLLTLMNTSM